MLPVQMSSGDLVADRRASYAEMLFEGGDRGAAADLMRDAVGLAPAWPGGWYRLGEMLADAGRSAEAVEAWREALRLDPQDRLGATLRLGLVGAAAGIDAPPPGFVETLFDQYAGAFDEALVERLDYRVPELLAEAILAQAPGRFAHLLDLGCGTGLMGERLARHASFLEGVDISAGMLKRAEAKQIYGRLAKADLNLMEFPAGVDLVTAADVFMYVGAIDALVARLSAALADGAVLAFSVEQFDGPGDMALRPSRRYAHSRAYVERVLSASGFAVEMMTEATIRMDRGEPVAGLIVVARRMAGATAGLDAAADQLPTAVHPAPR